MGRAPRAQAGGSAGHDGPFAETKEQLGGYYLVDVPDLAAAIAIAKKLPLSPGGSVEIRPLLRDE
ncbi:MAG TPA: YciI family protein [Stellaceae bacterium]